MNVSITRIPMRRTAPSDDLRARIQQIVADAREQAGEAIASSRRMPESRRVGVERAAEAAGLAVLVASPIVSRIVARRMTPPTRRERIVALMPSVGPRPVLLGVAVGALAVAGGVIIMRRRRSNAEVDVMEHVEVASTPGAGEGIESPATTTTSREQRVPVGVSGNGAPVD